MLLQTQPGAQMMIMGFFTGIITFAIIFYTYRAFQKKLEALKVPVVILLDLTTFKMYMVGYYVDINDDVLIPVKDGNSKQLWAVETDMYYIIPSHGNKEDIIIRDRGLRSVIIMIAQLIGVSRDGPEVHAEWCKDVFPPEIYTVPEKLAAIPNNYIFVRPLGKNSWIKGALRQEFNEMRHVYMDQYKTLQKYEQQIEELHIHYGNLNLHRIQSGNEMNISNWQYVMEAWDYLMRERTVPLSVISRLLNVSNVKVGYSGLHTVLSHGGINDAGKFLSAVTRAVQGLTNQLGMTPVSTPLFKAMTQKVNQQQDDLAMERDRNEKAIAGLQQLSRQVSDASRAQITVAEPEPETQAPASKKKKTIMV
jgi:hypothetical protein